ncbi:uncharacterized protein LOC108904567 [Anoplophora glabripennis]|uniref:uncharacterized protein LOC108904567 n=1 Tax=Anoplophora glabripennis TaxID=217634 RepID=UPI0008737512|nr:uncharacterized protein LOC108904567 [Anoplophora glabripennis]
MYRQLLTLTITNIICAICAPTEHPQQNAVYDFSKFDEVYDQRQNGTENIKVDVNGVVVVWAAPEAVLSAVSLLEPGLLDGDYSDLEELLGSQKPLKPENLLVVSPERPSSSTTTALPPSLVTESGGDSPQKVQNNTARHENIKRKYRIPLFIRPFLARRKQ